MRSFAFIMAGGFAALATATVTTSSMVCNADNCLRAIRASAFPTRMGTADCSSYFITTVTPATYTSTVTPVSTITVYNNRKHRRSPVAAPEPTLEARQVTVAPSSIPAYASPCSGSVRYSSACSCIGVTATTTTAPTPTTVITVAPATSTVVDTYPFVEFTGYSDTGCSEGNLGTGSFIENQCVELPDQISLEDDALNPGTCADTSSCVLSLYFYGGGCSAAYFARTIPVAAGCNYVGDVFYGQLVCPGC